MNLLNTLILKFPLSWGYILYMFKYGQILHPTDTLFSPSMESRHVTGTFPPTRTHATPQTSSFHITNSALILSLCLFNSDSTVQYVLVCS